MCQQHKHAHELFAIEALFSVDDAHDFFRIDRVANLIESAVAGFGRCPDCLSTEALIPSYEDKTWIYSIEHNPTCPRAGMIEQAQNAPES